MAASITGTRNRLSAYLNLKEELRIQSERLARKRETLGDVGSPSMESARVGRTTGDEAMCRRVAEMEELAQRVDHLEAAAKTEGDILERAICSLRVPEQREVLILRYLDGMDWDAVVFAKYGGRTDYLTREEDYRQSVYSLHNRACASLACAIARVA